MSGDAGLIAIAVSVVAAFIGWASTRGSDSSRMVTDYMREINADNVELRARVDHLEEAYAESREENRLLVEHIARCDLDNEAHGRRIVALEALLRRLLGNEAVDSLDGL